MIKLKVTYDIDLVNLGHHNSNCECTLEIDMIKKRLKFEDLEEYITDLLERTFNGEVSNVRLEEL